MDRQMDRQTDRQTNKQPDGQRTDSTLGPDFYQTFNALPHNLKFSQSQIFFPFSIVFSICFFHWVMKNLVCVVMGLSKIEQDQGLPNMIYFQTNFIALFMHSLINYKKSNVIFEHHVPYPIFWLQKNTSFVHRFREFCNKTKLPFLMQEHKRSSYFL